jgi:hypothetical protein
LGAGSRPPQADRPDHYQIMNNNGKIENLSTYRIFFDSLKLWFDIF